MPAKSFYIELPPDASATLKLAGRELSHYVRAVLGWEDVSSSVGGDLRVPPPASEQKEGPHIGGPLQKKPEEKPYRLRLGTRRTSFVYRTFLNQVMRPLGDDGFRTVADATTTTFSAETDKGVLNAVYSFLSSSLRVKWVEPGPVGEVLPRREVRSWWPLDVTEAPAFSTRGMHVTENTQWYREEDVRRHLEWMARNRLNRLVVYSNYSYERLRKVLIEECRLRGIDLEVEILTHNQFLPMELFEEHPEYFPVVGGERVGRSFVQRCASSREGVALYIRKLLAWVREHPEAEVVSLMSNDGRGYCECEACRGMSPAEQFSKFLYPALAALRTEFPQRQFASRAYCYRYDPLEPDAECRLGVGLMFDTFIRCRWHELGSDACDVPVRDPGIHDVSKGATANRYLLNVLKEWKSIATGPVTVFENVAQHGLVSQPVVNPEVVTRDMTTYRSLGLEGAVVLGHTHSFGSYVLNFNLFARLAWDLEGHWRGIWTDLCVIYFGGYSVRVIDLFERLRERGEGRFDEAEWRSLEQLMGPAFGGEGDLFAKRYARLRESFLYIRGLARLDDAGARLRKSRAEGNRPEALAAIREAHASYLAAWDIVRRNSVSGMFDTLDVLAKFIVRGTNAETLGDRFAWFPRPFWQTADRLHRVVFWDYLARLEGEGLSIDDIHARLEGEFAGWRSRFAALEPRLEELLETIDFGFGRPW